MAMASVFRRMTVQTRASFVGSSAVVLAAVTALVVAAPAPGPAGASVRSSARTPGPETEAVQTYNALQHNLYEQFVSLYQGLPSNSCDPYSCLWPFSNAAAGTYFLYGSPGGSTYLSDTSARLVGLGHYADASEVSPSGVPQPPAYESAVAPPLGHGGSTYYDDNGWVGLNLVHAYLLTSNSADLTLAEDEFSFALSGWDANASDPCPGGVFWEDVAGSQRNATANGANAELGLELYRLTGNPSDLSMATTMYQWVGSCLNAGGGLYDDHVNANGTVNTTIWSYNQGVMIGAGVLLYQITGNTSYLSQAKATAAAAVAYFGTGPPLVNQGPAFNAIYFRNLFLLNQVAPNSTYATDAQSFGATMWAQRQASGLIDPQYGVNGTAPMVEIYALLAGSSPAP
jgi:hypothetical protein